MVGDSLFIIKAGNGSYKKLWIKRLAANVYTFSYADLDGNNQMDKSITKTDFTGKNFAYFSFTQKCIG